jgi:exo-1,4-beta-D-glucosaminidase
VIESLRKMLPADELWPPNDVWDYHCTHSKEAFNTMDVFNRALDERYGKPGNLQDYLLKSDAQSYEAVKAMFEAFRSRIPVATGIIQWMLNSAWPSLYWHLYDYYLQPSAAYYAVRKANQPVQLIYDYGDNSVYAVNETLKAVSDYGASVKMLDINSQLVFKKDLHFNLGSGNSERLLVLDSINGMVFLDLRISGPNGKPVSGNFYWINGKPDEFDWGKTTWAYTPMKDYTDFMALNTLAESAVNAEYEVKHNGDNEIVTASLTNTSGKVAFFISLALYDENGGRINPVFWDDNYLSLLPGEKRAVSCTVSKHILAGIMPRVVLAGWNIKQQSAELK